MASYDDPREDDDHDDTTDYAPVGLFRDDGSVNWNNQAFVACPVCLREGNQAGVEHMHPETVTVDCGGTVTEVLGKGEVETLEHECNARGAIIALQFCCESGHRTRVILQFHKGTTFVRIHDVMPSPTPHTLWRD